MLESIGIKSHMLNNCNLLKKYRLFYLPEQHKNNTQDIVMSLQSLTDPEQWKDIGQSFDTAHSLCEFYGLQGEETNLQTELRVFHYKCPKRTVRSMLEIFKEHDAHIIFPTLFKLI